MRLRAATRGSELARWQTDHVAELLRRADPTVEVEVVVVDTVGDRRHDVPISELGGKGVFAKEVQEAVLDGRADIAVHSAKDLPSVTVDGLTLAAVPERGNPLDALVGATLPTLRRGATVATGSNRRRVQLSRLRPDLNFAELRGNIATRLAKGRGFDAIVVAAVALERLGLADHIAHPLPVESVVPQVGQGALAIECRADDDEVAQVVNGIEHPPSRRRVDAERAFLAELGGDCELPAGAYAVNTSIDGALTLEAILAEPDESQVHRLELHGNEPFTVGRQAAIELRNRLTQVP